MPLYLLRANYTVEGTRGLLKEGGTSRRATVQKAVEQGGGKMHGFYYALGQDDAYVIVEVPDVATVAALSLTVNASGAVSLSTTALVTPEEIDAACKKSVGYRAPGA